MLTVLTNIRSTKLLHHASCIAGSRMRFGKLTALKNIMCYGRWKTTFGEIPFLSKIGGLDLVC